MIGATLGMIFVCALLVVISVTLSEIRMRKQVNRLWDRVNDNTKRLNRLQTSKNWRKYGSDIATTANRN